MKKNTIDINLELRKLLDGLDIDTDGMLNRKKSREHVSDTQLLLEHLRIYIQDLKFDLFVTRNELFEIRKLLEE